MAVTLSRQDVIDHPSEIKKCIKNEVKGVNANEYTEIIQLKNKQNRNNNTDTPATASISVAD